MTEADAPEPAPDDALPPYPPADAILSTLVALANATTSSSFSLTVLTPAGAVTGTAMNGADWMREQARQLESVANGVGVGLYVKMFDDMADRYHEDDSNDTEGDDPELVLVDPAYVHFRDARVVTGSGAAPGLGSPGGLWRVAIKDVSGWMFGTLS